MAVQTEAAVVADVIRMELPHDFNRDEIIVSDGVTVALGSACKLDSSDEVVLATGAAQNEVQLVNIAGTLTAGDFRIGVTLPSTDPLTPGALVFTDVIAWNTTFSTVISSINTALDALLGSAKIVATGSAWTAITFTFSGSGFSAIDHAPLALDVAELDTATTVVVTQTTAGHVAGGDPTMICIGDQFGKSVVGDGTLKAIFVVRGPVVANADQIIVASGGKAATVAALKLLGIIARDQPAERTVGLG